MDTLMAMVTPPVSVGILLSRGLRKRCALCGQGHLFRRWTKMVETCPRCGHRFTREEGFWVGAIIMNTAATEALFGVLFLATVIATAPEVPWAPLLAVGLGTNAIFPIFFYPFSKTIWVAVDILLKRWTSAPSIERRGSLG
ncbi:MAG TPA: DUF983 domain-containing protein [Actinomycetota bacterium]|nr:DUF983 domain-containing protein [Actinomycetota bacterium]